MKPPRELDHLAPAAQHTMPRPDLDGPAAHDGSHPSPGATAGQPGAAPDKIVRLRFAKSGERYTLAVPASSPWHELLPDEQDVIVEEHTP